MRRPLLPLVLALVLAPGVAEARARVVLLVDSSGPEVAAATRRAALEGAAAALARVRGCRVLREPEAEAALTARVSELLAKAQAHSRAFEEQQALAVLARAEEAIRAALGPVASVEPLARVLLARVRLHAELGREKDLRRELSRLLVLDPRRPLDAGALPPSVLRAAVKLRRAASRARGKVELHAAAGLPLYLDGRELGRGAAEAQVAPGEHFAVAGVGPRAVGKAVKVTGRTARVELTLAAEPATPAWREQAAREGATHAVLVRVAAAASGQRVELELQPLGPEAVAPRRLAGELVDETGVAARTRELAARLFPRPRRAAAATLTTTATTPRATEPVRDAVAARPARRTSVVRSWWLWTIVGAVVAGSVTAAVLATRDRGSRIHVELVH